MNDAVPRVSRHHRRRVIHDPAGETFVFVCRCSVKGSWVFDATASTLLASSRVDPTIES